MTADDGHAFSSRKFVFQSPRQPCDKSYAIAKKLSFRYCARVICGELHAMHDAAYRFLFNRTVGNRVYNVIVGFFLDRVEI